MKRPRSLVLRMRSRPKWDDLDIGNKTIFVSKQYARNPNGELTLSRPKTEASVRRVSIPQEAVDLLIQEHDKHPDNQYMKWKGDNLYTILPVHSAVGIFHQRQLRSLELDVARSHLAAQTAV